jgi:hypothetical protein
MINFDTVLKITKATTLILMPPLISYIEHLRTRKKRIERDEYYDDDEYDRSYDRNRY